MVASCYSESLHLHLRDNPWRKSSIRLLIGSLARLVERYYVFVHPGVDRCEVLPDGPSNVHIASFDEISECLCRERIDIWHSFGYDADEGISSLGHRSKREFCMTADCAMPDVCRSAQTGGANWNYYDGIIYPAKLVQTLHLRYSSVRESSVVCTTIPTAIDLGAANSIGKNDARGVLRLPQNALLLLCLSDFSPRHGTDLLPIIGTFQMAKRHLGDVWLILCGADGGNLSSALRRDPAGAATRGRTILLANPDSCSLTMLLSAADVLLHLADAPSNDSPEMLLNAMAHGLPIIASRWPSSESIIEQENSGILISNYTHAGAFKHLAGALCCGSEEMESMILSQATALDVPGVATEFVRLAADSDYRITLGENARRIVHAQNQPEKAALSYVAFWQGLRLRKFRGPDPAGAVGAGDCRRVSLLCECAASLDTDSPLHLTLLGDAVLSGGAPGIYEDMNGVLLVPILYELLELSRSGMSPAALVARMASASDEVPAWPIESGVLYHVLWCLKRGLLTSEQFPGWKSLTEVKE